jgi:hypothetical protein
LAVGIALLVAVLILAFFWGLGALRTRRPTLGGKAELGR